MHRSPLRYTYEKSDAMVCYAFNINLSSWIGGVALRYRLYSRWGLRTSTITEIISLSVLTNSLGYIIVAGIVFSLRLVQLPQNWILNATALQWAGFTLLSIAGTYLLACHFSRRRACVWKDDPSDVEGAIAQKPVSSDGRVVVSI